jgi:chemotaxis protein CheD
MALLIVGIGDCKVSNDSSDVLVTHALGSCIAVLLYDASAKVAGLLHYMLPESNLDKEKARGMPYTFADTGIPLLLENVFRLGAAKSRLVAIAAGGAQMMDPNGTFNIGHRNLLALRKVFWKFGVIVHREEVGGISPRTVSINVASGRVQLRTPGAAQREIEINSIRNGGADGLQHTHRR